MTHCSVCNTVKCGLAVWISVPIFGNDVTLLSGVGSFIVIVGELLYNKARDYEDNLRTVAAAYGSGVVPVGVDVYAP